MINAKLIDQTGSTFLTFFDEQASIILGVTARQLEQQNRLGEAAAVLKRMTHRPWRLHMVGEIGVFKDQPSVKYQIKHLQEAPEARDGAVIDLIMKY